MSYDEYDAARDEFYDRVREELTEEIVGEFTSKRLTSYYNQNLKIAEKPYRALTEARTLIATHETAALIQAVIASEVTIKSVLLQPIVIGFVHNEIIAPLITEMVLKQTRGQFEQVEKLLLKILAEVAGLNLQTYLRAGSKENLWKEILEIQKTRNAILHRAEVATKAQAEFAIAVASEVVEVVFPRVAKNLGYHLHKGFELCAKHDCSPEWLAICEKMGIAVAAKK